MQAADPCAARQTLGRAAPTAAWVPRFPAPSTGGHPKVATPSPARSPGSGRPARPSSTPPTEAVCLALPSPPPPPAPSPGASAGIHHSSREEDAAATAVSLSRD